jgi:S-DNA-T family DNA segregation ATPase FtsK/SpoIIIE
MVPTCPLRLPGVTYLHLQGNGNTSATQVGEQQMTGVASRGRATFAHNPTGQLPPQRPTWPGRAVAAFAAGVIAVGLSVVAEQPHLGVAAGVAAAAIAIAVAVFGIRAHRRRELFDAATESVLPMLGARIASRELVRASRWAGGWIGVPTRIRIRYAATVDDGDPRFVETILDNMRRRLGVDYRVTRHLPKRCILLIELDLRDPDQESPEVARAEKVAKELLGATAKVACELDGEGAVIGIDVRYDTSPRLSLTSYRQRLEKALSSMLPGRWRSEWDTVHDRVRFEIRPTMPSMVPHLPGAPRPELTHQSYDACKVAYCVDEDGHVQYWQPSVSPHMLIIGGTGSGKTSAEHTLLTDLALYGWRVWVLDGKRIEFAGYKDWPNVELVASKVGDQVRMIHAAHDLMEQRYSLIENGQARISDFEPLALIIDEYATFKARVVRWYKSVKAKGDPTQPPVFDLVADLARLARTAKIHMVIGIQRPDVDFLGGEMRDNFGARLSLGRLSPQGANMMWDSFAVGVAIPRNQRGRGVALDAESNPVEVQTFYTPDPAKLTPDKVDDWALLEQLRPEKLNYPRKMIKEPRSEIDYDKGEVAEPSYSAWASALIVNYDPAGARDADELPAPTAEVPGVRFVPSDEPEADESESIADGNLFEGYGDPAPTPIAEVNPGDLVLVDEGLDLWGVVEECEVDLLEEGYMSVDYRDLESGEPNTMSFPEGERVSVRRPADVDA